MTDTYDRPVNVQNMKSTYVWTYGRSVFKCIPFGHGTIPDGEFHHLGRRIRHREVSLHDIWLWII
jgi:hypothetical protein